MSARNFLDRIVGSLAARRMVRPAGERRADRLASLLRTLISERGEATGALLARRAVALYRGLDADGRQRFRMNMARGGTAALLDLRREVIAATKSHPQLAVVDHDRAHLLGSWINRGFLELRRIDWGTPASILEKLITYEAVHEIRGFPDLKRRLSATGAASPSSIPLFPTSRSSSSRSHS